MKKAVHHQLSVKQAAHFLAANGLHLWTPEQPGATPLAMALPSQATSVIVAPGGELAGGLRPLWGGVVRVTMEECNEGDTRTWWPGFRPVAAEIEEECEGEVGCLEPHDVYCSRCSTRIWMRPVPVVGRDALCGQCFVQTGKMFPGIVEPYLVQDMGVRECGKHFFRVLKWR